MECSYKLSLTCQHILCKMFENTDFSFQRLKNSMCGKSLVLSPFVSCVFLYFVLSSSTIAKKYLIKTRSDVKEYGEGKQFVI